MAGDGTVYSLGGIGKGQFSTQIFVRRSLDWGRSWQTVYLYPKEPGQPIFSEGAFAIDLSGSLYFATEGDDLQGTSQVIYFKSTDRGETWYKIFQLAEREAGFYIDGMIFDGNTLYSSIWTREKNQQIKWHIRRDNPVDNRWSYIDLNYEYAAGGNTLPMGLLKHGDGRVFASGYGSGGKAQGTRWLTRVYDEASDHWAVVDDYQFAAGKNSYSVGLALGVQGTLFAAGGGGVAASTAWVVRAEDAKGGGWRNVDVFYLDKGRYAAPTAIKADSRGNIYVVGSANHRDGSNRWVVRKGSPSGSTWQTVDQFQLAHNKHCDPGSLTIDAKDSVYVSGTCFNAAGKKVSVTRRFRPAH